MVTNGTLPENLQGPLGYDLSFSLQATELAAVKRLIERQWLAHLAAHAPDAAEQFAARGIEYYHEHAGVLDHGSIWPKRARILPLEAVQEIRQTTLLKKLADALGEFTISDEDEVGWEEIYWRLVRPGEPADVGPLHADRWFWELDKMPTPAGAQRVKVWVAVVCEPGRNGLQVVPGSHHRDWRWHGEPRFGRLKPQIDEDTAALNPELLPTQPGAAVVFHDSLLHGGVVNTGTTTRVSFEFTMFVRACAATSHHNDS